MKEKNKEDQVVNKAVEGERKDQKRQEEEEGGEKREAEEDGV